MALLHRAEIRPTKLELLSAWLPTRHWFLAPSGAQIQRVAAYRFDDPAGAVGIETILVRADGGPTYQVPLTYRGAPLDGGDAWLVGTLEHSVLGRRWVYDGCGDPVYAAALASVIFGSAGQAEEFFEVDGERRFREPEMRVTGGANNRAETPTLHVIRRVVAEDPTLIVTDAVELTVARAVDRETPAGDAILTGTWGDRPAEVLLASGRLIPL